MKPLSEILLDGRDLRAVKAAAGMLTERFAVEKVILYGSKARGDAGEDSDIDLLLVTTRPIHWRERKAMIDALFLIEMENDVLISILTITATEWAEGVFTQFPVYREIVRDGVIAA